MRDWLDRGLGFAVPLLIALLVSAVVLLLIGENPLDTFSLMLTEGFGSPRRFASTLSAATPLLFTAVGTAICFRAGVFNVGVDGAFLIGGLAAVVAGFSLPAGFGWALAPACMVIAAIFGAAWLFVPGWLLAKLEVDEVVSTLMLNFIAVAITGYLVNGPFLSAQSGNNVTPPVHEAAELSRLMPPATLHSGFLLALAVLVAYALWARRTPTGLEGAWVGLNRRFSRVVGVSVQRTIILAMVLSGIVGGLGGAAHGLGQLHRFTDGFSAGYGFTGMAVALLARNTPVGMLIGAILFGALASAGTTIQLFSNIPLDLVNIIQGIVMIFAVIELGRITILRRAKA
ncbi:ABC transporter permease [Hoeflea sp. AS16]|uniref:ABC transporter permease n=1 Tax=unclassified Hoeflea TaxID=2614931 RepID=UPI003181D7BB